MAIENVMNKKVKKVLSYIGVACLGALIGMGALIGVSSCSKQDNQQQVKAKVNKKQQYFGYDVSNLYILKPNSELTAQYDWDKLPNISVDSDIFSGNSPLGQYIDNIGAFSMVNVETEYQKIQFGLTWTTGYFKLSFIKLYGGATEYYIYNTSEGIRNDNLIALNVDSVFYYPRRYLTLENDYALIDLFFDKFENSETMTFNFAKQINYNSPYGWDISSTFVYDVYFDSSHLSKVMTYDLPTFVSGGFIFNQIKVYYSNAMATSYIDTEGNRQLFESYSFCYYQQMEYFNSITSNGVVVNKRDMLAWSSGNASGYSVTRSSNWVSNDFQELVFTKTLTPQQRLNLNQFNNNQYGDSFAISQNNDVGLGNAFELLTLAFSSWVPILSIQIIPGITIGLLLFLPLIAGIIVLVIWIVKR